MLVKIVSISSGMVEVHYQSRKKQGEVHLVAVSTYFRLDITQKPDIDFAGYQCYVKYTHKGQLHLANQPIRIKANVHTIFLWIAAIRNRLIEQLTLTCPKAVTLTRPCEILDSRRGGKNEEK